MCSYLGTYPPSLAKAAIELFSRPGGVVLDPFSGRGTTLLEARLGGRRAYASDLNPIAVALSRAKASDVSYREARARIAELEGDYDRVLYGPEAQVQSEAIQTIFHPGTLAQLCYLRDSLVDSDNPTDQFLVGCLLGIMHGAERQDGSSAYASISMPNTFSMSPNYVRRYVSEKRLNRCERNVFELLGEKVGRLSVDPEPNGPDAIVSAWDAKTLSMNPALAPVAGAVDLIVTSPPYLDVVNYAKQNWIRGWLFDRSRDSGLVELLDDDLNLSEWMTFSSTVLEQFDAVLSPSGIVVFIVGDVVKPKGSSISLAREFIRRAVHDGRFGYVGCLDDRIGDDSKTTRIWAETKGRATQTDRIIVLARSSPEMYVEQLSNAFDGSLGLERQSISSRRLAAYARRFAGL